MNVLVIVVVVIVSVVSSHGGHRHVRDRYRDVAMSATVIRGDRCVHVTMSRQNVTVRCHALLAKLWPG